MAPNNLYIYKNKSVEPHYCLFSYQRFLQDPTSKNKQHNAHAEYECHQTESSTRGRSAGGINISHKGVYCLLVLGLRNFAGFLIAKTSANKRFYNMSAKSIAQLCAAKVQIYFGLSKIFAIYRKNNRSFEPIGEIRNLST